LTLTNQTQKRLKTKNWLDKQVKEKKLKLLGCTVADILGQKNNTLNLVITNPQRMNRKNGLVSITAFEMEEKMSCLWCCPTYKRLK
jgi:hypothetical protein